MASLTYADIETRVMNALRIPTSNTTEATKIAATINEIYRDIGAKFDWWWLKKRSIINTEADLTTGTISVTQDNTAVTFSDGPAETVAGRVLIVDDQDTDSGAIYRISTHVAASTSAVLDGEYTGTTDTSSTFKVYKDTYDLPTDTAKLLHVKRYGYPWPMEQIDVIDMLDLKGWDTSEGSPQLYCVLDFDTTGDPTTQRQLIIHPYPDEIYRMELSYKRTLNTELSSTTRPLIPDDYVQILVYGALAIGYPIYLNDVMRGQLFDAKFKELLALMTAVQREREGNPRIEVQDQHRSFYSSKRRVSPATADMGSYFDRWPVQP